MVNKQFINDIILQFTGIHNHLWSVQSNKRGGHANRVFGDAVEMSREFTVCRIIGRKTSHVQEAKG